MPHWIQTSSNTCTLAAKAYWNWLEQGDNFIFPRTGLSDSDLQAVGQEAPQQMQTGSEGLMPQVHSNSYPQEPVAGSISHTDPCQYVPRFCHMEPHRRLQWTILWLKAGHQETQHLWKCAETLSEKENIKPILQLPLLDFHDKLAYQQVNQTRYKTGWEPRHVKATATLAWMQMHVVQTMHSNAASRIWRQAWTLTGVQEVRL